EVQAPLSQRDSRALQIQGRRAAVLDRRARRVPALYRGDVHTHSGVAAGARPVRRAGRCDGLRLFGRGVTRGLRTPYCLAEIPRSFAAIASLLRWSSIESANWAGPPMFMTCPVVLSRSSMILSAEAALTSAAMRSRVSFGISGGPNRPTSPSRVSAG